MTRLVVKVTESEVRAARIGVRTAERFDLPVDPLLRRLAKVRLPTDRGRLANWWLEFRIDHGW